MSRADRVLRLEDLLRSSGPTTVRVLAQRLGVTPRTVFRDLALLRDRGLPLEGTAGPDGGIRIIGGRGLTAVHLSIDEVVALWLAAQVARAASELPWDRHAAAALAKMILSLPAARAIELRSLCSRIFVGPEATATMKRNPSPPPANLLALVERAASHGHALRFEYQGLHGSARMRSVEPHGLLIQPPLWYILARDCDRDAPRMFRMDRVRRPVALPEVRFEPRAAVARSLLPAELPFVSLMQAWPSATRRDARTPASAARA